MEHFRRLPEIAGLELVPTELDRVRRNTAPHVNQAIDRETEERIRACATLSEAGLTERIRQLHGEWDIERILEINAPALALAGLLFGLVRSRKWFFLSATVCGFLAWHGIKGWCPPIPALRRLGIRTRREIDAEIYALKVLRGDFRDAESSGLEDRMEDVFRRAQPI
ncbi:MAG: hypothetical protein JO317_05820 [Verrucomicrobiae bacterium]|nr:hypothetical protein [Verrucomicrobiae bacterium]